MASDAAPDTSTGQTKAPTPQATLQGIRAVVDACSRGAHTSDAIRTKALFSKRHAAYAIGAARLLGLVLDTATGFALSPDGQELAGTSKGSESEADVFSRRIASTDAIEDVAPGLLTANLPSVTDVARTMRERAGLSPNTATHRARMLLKWREVLVNRRMEFARARPATQRGTMPVLHVRNFAQIEDARIEFGDLTILVGPQATGKSLVLQWFKAAIDMGEIFAAL